MDIYTAHLPESLQDLIAVVGLNAAIKLASSVGGVRHYVPADPETSNIFMLALGDKYPDFHEVYRGVEYEAPKADKVVQQLRHSMIIQQHMDGKPISEIALSAGYGWRQVQRVIANHKKSNYPPEDSQQLDLF